MCWDDYFGKVLEDDWYVGDPAPGIESTSLYGSDAQGVRIEARCLSKAIAVAWLKEEFARRFGSATHELVTNDLRDDGSLYALLHPTRDGD